MVYEIKTDDFVIARKMSVLKSEFDNLGIGQMAMINSIIIYFRLFDGEKYPIGFSL